ncbi:DUF2721 domain-containing protein [Methylocystis sp. ATCC 49242]|uniref:DUF2721 domain-containing protein n=1 Tax=Methylocystis sp. ATCC 49242 TaxID=622637 RepID=UPI0001F87BEE|nr:DUF2721 domain-containing protein [Methylocystis sp. ATCC 49242]
MLINTPSIEQLSNVISEVTGPAFLLAAEAQLLAALVSRLDRIIDRSRSMGDQEAGDRESELRVLRRRADLMHRAIYWGVASCIVTSLLVIVSFAAAFFHIPHEYGAGLLFALAMAPFTAALIAFAREVRLGYWEIDAQPMLRRTPAGKSYPHA